HAPPALLEQAAVERLRERAVAFVARLAQLRAQCVGDVRRAERAHLVAPRELLRSEVVPHRCALSTRCAPDLQGEPPSHCAPAGATVGLDGPSMSRRAAIALAFLVAVAVSYRPSGVVLAQPLAPLSPATQQAIENYVRDPNGSGRQLLDAARQEQTGTLNPIHELLIGDAASRAGLYRTAAA